MKKLKEEDIIKIMREEWDKNVKKLSEEINLTLKDDNDLISPDLKIRHKNSGILYTVDSVGPRDVILRTPEDKKFIVDTDTLESEYELG